MTPRSLRQEYRDTIYDNETHVILRLAQAMLHLVQPSLVAHEAQRLPTSAKLLHLRYRTFLFRFRYQTVIADMNF